MILFFGVDPVECSGCTVTVCDLDQLIGDQRVPKAILENLGAVLAPEPNTPLPLDLAVWDDPRFVNIIWMEYANLEDVIIFAERLEQRIDEVRAALRSSGAPPPE